MERVCLDPGSDNFEEAPSSCVVETEETEDASSSSPAKLKKLVLVCDRFFFGIGASVFPGSSLLSRL